MTKALVIDDEQPTLKMFRFFLGAYGYRVLTAENGPQGLQILEAENPQIVFTDIKMPGMDGLEVLRRIKTKHPLTEVIVMTGHGDMDLAVQALNLDATDFINKPIQKSALDSALRRAEERLKASGTRENEVYLRTMEEGITVIDIKGNVSSASEQMLLDVHQESPVRDAPGIVLHFDENAAVNGAGIAVLIQLLSASQKRNQAVGITGVSENFKKIFDMVGITRFAALFDSETDAVGHLVRHGHRTGKQG